MIMQSDKNAEKAVIKIMYIIEIIAIDVIIVWSIIGVGCNCLVASREVAGCNESLKLIAIIFNNRPSCNNACQIKLID